MSHDHLLPWNAPIRSTRRGLFWVTGEPVVQEAGTFSRGPMYVEWEAPENISQPLPLVLVHGGGGQGTDWLATLDQQHGWAQHFVDAGFVVYVVDRPGHGRSPHHPDVMGEPGGQFSYEWGERVFVPPGEPDHTQWPGGQHPGDSVMDQFMASAGFMLKDVAAAQTLESERLAALLDVVGPAILVTHSAGAPSGWLAANLRPGLVAGIVSVEPQSPPFSSRSGNGDLVWGITAAPIVYDPPAQAPSELARPLPGRALPGLVGMPVVVVTGAASKYFVGTAPAMVDFLVDAGARAEWLNLGDHQIDGNGHAMMLEKNSGKAIEPIIRWITTMFE